MVKIGEIEKEEENGMWIPPLDGLCHPVCDASMWVRSHYLTAYGVKYIWDDMSSDTYLSQDAVYPPDAGRRSWWRVRCALHSGGTPSETFSFSEYQKIYIFLLRRIAEIEKSGFGFSRFNRLSKFGSMVTDSASSNGNSVRVDVVVNVIIDGVKSQRVLKYE